MSAQNRQDPIATGLERSRRTRHARRRTLLVVLAIPVVVFSALVYVSTDQLFATILTAALIVACFLAAWALNARHDRRGTRRVHPLQQARSELDVDLIRKARVAHGESAGITEIRRQLPALSYEQAVELHRYV